MWRDYLRAPAGVARVMADLPFSDGTTALEILNFRMDETGVLDSTFRAMPFIPTAWQGASQPAPFIYRCLGIGFYLRDGEVPEILFIANWTGITGTALWKYAPWGRATGGTEPGLEGVYHYPYVGTVENIRPEGVPLFNPVIRQAGNDLYISFCGGGRTWRFDGHRACPVGFQTPPVAPCVEGPASPSGGTPNTTGFFVTGRIGSTDSQWTNGGGNRVGGVNAGHWRYAVVFEDTTGAYSATSADGGMAGMDTAPGDITYFTDRLGRKFRVHSIPKGPAGTVARILLRTMNLDLLPDGDSGEYHFLHRISGNTATEWIDNIPDGELGPVWVHRMAVPPAILIQPFGGSMLYLGTLGHPARMWWSEQTANGPIYGSVLDGHWRDVFPETGGFTASMPYKSIGDSSPGVILLFKSDAAHFAIGEYPTWEPRTLHPRAGCAGPHLVQATPDGAVVWYGAGTFWRLDPNGTVDDVGGPIRGYLKRVNTSRAKLGTSFIDRAAGEAVFTLPLDDDLAPSFDFVWDYRLHGWRLRQWMDEVYATLALPTGLVLISGVVNKVTTVWAWMRGYPGYVIPTPTWAYTTGWTTMERLQEHDLASARGLVVTIEERAAGNGGIAVHSDWNLDAASSIENFRSADPEDDDVPFYYPVGADFTAALYASSVYRTRRPVTQRVAAHAPSGEVFAVRLSGTYPVGIIGIDIYGPKQAGPGGRTRSPV